LNNADQQDDAISAITLRSNRTPARSTTQPAPADGTSTESSMMNVAFIQQAQHDIDSDQRGADQIRLSGQRVLKPPAPCLGKLPRIVPGTPVVLSDAWIAATASPSA